MFVIFLSLIEKHERQVLFYSFLGPIRHAKIIYDVKTGNSRGFGFIYFDEIEDASAARRACNGMSLLSKRIRVDYSITKRPHTPTPGKYMGHYRRRGGFSPYISDRRSSYYFRSWSRSS